MPEYLPRLVDPLLVARLASFPALMMVGPRASGKTTTALEFVRTTVRLDTPGEEAAFRADPDGAVRGLEEPVLLDEWQNVPELLGAVKRSVDGDPSPGRFVLAGSVRAELDPLGWPGTGRLLPLRMHGLTLRELTGNAYGAGLLQRITDGEELAPPASTPDLRGYLELAAKGGFPQPAIRLSGADAEAWTRGYVDQLLTHDVGGVMGGRDSYRLHRYFTALASHSACVVDKKTLYGAADVDAKTANAYEHLLTNLYLLDLVPAWSVNRINRLARNPKRFLVDPSLVTATLGMSVDGVMRDKDMLGRILETFVAAQLRPELELGERPARLYHLRAEDGRREIDLLVELGNLDVVGIEVKATAAPTRRDARHLEWLRDQLGERFVTGLVLHTGSRSFRLSEKVTAAPISVLWGGSSRFFDMAPPKLRGRQETAGRTFGVAGMPLGPWGPVRYRMGDLEVGTIVRLNTELAKNIAAFDLAGAESIEVLGHGGGALRWSLVRTNDGRDIRVIDEDLEPALLSLEGER